MSGSASADDGWTTPSRPTSIATPMGSPQTWSDSVVTRSTQPAYRSPPPPPPPGGAPTMVAPAAPCPPPAAAPVAVAPAPMAPRAWSGCGLPCESGISQWHARAVGGYSFWEGTDAPDGCLYWGADVGRTFCGCWGLDAFYRYSPATFDRFVPPGAAGLTEDGGKIHHVGIKLTYEKAFGQSRFYGWGGLGPEYWWTDDYIDDDSGFGAFGELGVGYVFSQNFRVRAGVNVHWMPDIETGRYDPADDGQGRDLWIFAPVLELEVAF